MLQLKAVAVHHALVGEDDRHGDQVRAVEAKVLVEVVVVVASGVVYSAVVQKRNPLLPMLITYRTPALADPIVRQADLLDGP